jgi:hypothetical protein
MKQILTAGLMALAVAAFAIAPSAAFAKTCSAGYIHGVIGGAQKCLRRGEYCAHGYATQYHRYGFDCVIVSGAFHLEPRSLHRVS